MAEYVYVGRRRNRAKMAVYQILTLGVYGRVWLYKILREIDGHEALFLDRRIYLPLLVLPFIGPLLVKRRVAILLHDLVHHDITAKAYHRARFMLLAWIPLLPFFHVYVQSFLNHHWSMHSKEEELKLKEEQLAGLRRSRSAASQEKAAALEEEVGLRRKELDEMRRAATVLREAKEYARLAKRERRHGTDASGVVRKRFKLPALRRSSPDEVPEEPAAEPEAVAEASEAPKGFFASLGLRRKEPPIEEAPPEPATPETPPEVPLAEPPTNEPASSRSRPTPRKAKAKSRKNG